MKLGYKLAFNSTWPSVLSTGCYQEPSQV